MKHEIRAGMPAEVRAENGTVKVSGYAAVFNQEVVIGGYFREVIAPGAFTDAVGRDDVVFLVNHDGLPLARTRSGTLKLKEDKHGLHMESELDADDPDVIAITRKMKRGDLDKMSFGFIPEVQEWDDSEEIPLRTIKRASLFDVSIVTNPAYDGTEIGLRSLEQHRSAKKESEHDNTATAARMRMRLSLSGAKTK
jgi:HK97 family phage prohead protease